MQWGKATKKKYCQPEQADGNLCNLLLDAIEFIDLLDEKESLMLISIAVGINLTIYDFRKVFCNYHKRAQQF